MRHGRRVSRVCVQCEKEFLALAIDVNRGDAKFCSVVCYDQYRKIHGVPSRHKRIPRICLECNKEFWVHESRIRRNKGGREGSFCSKKCVYEYWKKNGSSVQRPRGLPAHEYGFPPRTKRDKWVDSEGYVHLSIKIKGTKRYYKEHRFVMEQVLGRGLYSWEAIHHKDGNKSNNDLQNLEIWEKKHSDGVRAKDIYQADNERLLLRISQLESELAELKT